MLRRAGLLCCLLLVPTASLGAQQEPRTQPQAPEQPQTQREPQAPTSEPSAEDRAIEQRLRAAFGEIHAFRQLRLSVRHGVVELTGQAPTLVAREAADRLARAIPGVLYVENLTELAALTEPEQPGAAADASGATERDQRIAETIRRMFARLDDLARVEVDVVAGVVELRGRARDAGSKAKAEELARNVEGVVYVSNELEETVDLQERILPTLERILGFVQDAVLFLPLLVVASLVFLALWWVGRLLARLDRPYARLTRNRLLQGIYRQLVRTGLFLLGLFLALEILGATTLVGAVLGTAGVVGIALGFAFRDIAENYIASIILSVRQPFRNDDLVEIDGNLGTVVRMTMRDTVLLTPDGNHLILPNSTVFKSRLVNYTRAPLRRFDVAVGLGMEVDLQDAMRHGLAVLQRLAGVANEPQPFARVEALGDSNVAVRFFGWVDQRSCDYGKVKSEAVRLIKLSMDEHGMEMPVPQFRVELRRAGPEPTTEPAPQRTAHTEAATADVEPERQIEQQVDHDRRTSDEENLLAKDS